MSKNIDEQLLMDLASQVGLDPTPVEAVQEAPAEVIPPIPAVRPWLLRKP